LADFNLDYKKEEKTATGTDRFTINGLKLLELLISFRLSKNRRGKEFPTIMFVR
jgi:hypothetical protein